MTHCRSTASFDEPVSIERLERAAAALTAHGFTAEILDDQAAARARVRELIPESSSVLTASSETLRISGIDDDINTSGRYESVRQRSSVMDRGTQIDDIRRLVATPDVIVGSVSALIETGSLVIASGTGSQLPGYAGGAGHSIWVVGAQKVVPDLDTALCRIKAHCLPLESDRTQAVYGRPSAISLLLILNAPPLLRRGTVLILREAVGF